MMLCSILKLPSTVLFALLLSFGSAYSASATQELKILTLNVQQFSWGLVSKNNHARAKELTRIINERHTEFDVVAFQELWSNHTRHYISKHLREHYPYKYVDLGWGAYLVGYHSGLALYSKYPIKRHKRHSYRVYRDVELFAKKGIMAVELDVGGQPVNIAVTHLQASDEHSLCSLMDSCHSAFEMVVTDQLSEANRTLAKFRADQQEAPTFILGDFNIAADSKLYQDALKAIEGARDTYVAAPGAPTTTLWQDAPQGPRIDYIWVLGGQVQGSSQVVDYFPASVTDHLGVLGKFEWPAAS